MATNDVNPAKEPLAGKGIWNRGLAMLVVLMLVSLAQTVLAVCALVQFLWMLLSGSRNRPLADFAAGLAHWLAKATRFQTGTADERPFPWTDWGHD